MFTDCLTLKTHQISSKFSILFLFRIVNKPLKKAFCFESVLIMKKNLRLIHYSRYFSRQAWRCMKHTVLFVALVFFVKVCSIYGTSTDNLDAISRREPVSQQLSNISLEIAKTEIKLEKKKKKKTSITHSLNKTRRELYRQSIALKKIQNEMPLVESQVSKIEKKLYQQKKNYLHHQKVIRHHLRMLYSQEYLNVWVGLFSNKDLLAVTNSISYFKKILDKNRADLKESLKQKMLLEKQESNWKSKQSRLKKLTISAEKHRNILKKEEKNQSRYIHSLNKEIVSIKKDLDNLDQSSLRIQQLLRPIDSALKTQTLPPVPFQGTFTFIIPVLESWISSEFGMRVHPIFNREILHRGTDFAASSGTIIRAADSGRVLIAGQSFKYKGYGKITIIDHGIHPENKKRYSTVYAHQKSIRVKVGQIVSKGEIIGRVGTTGFSTGPHLHFELRIDGTPVDPQNYLPSN